MTVRAAAKALSRWDKKILWHPFTQQAGWAQDDILVVDKSRGSYIQDVQGRRYIDGVSSLWVTVHGHRHPAIVRAIQKQLSQNDHTTFLGLSHQPAIDLARALLRWTPPGLSRVFYSDNGSTSVEVALKMAYQFWLQKSGRARTAKTEFLALENSYHGDTLGAVSVGGIRMFHSRFRPLLFKTRFAAAPVCGTCAFRKKPWRGRLRTGDLWRGPAPRPGQKREETGCAWECLAAVKTKMAQARGRLAAAVIEPVVQGASGMQVMPPGYLAGFAKICRDSGVLLIADEVATGFGRTGTMFACQSENVRPDLLCLSKSITGGTLPLAATVATEKIYRAFLGRPEEFKTFFHGHTYTANPLACAAAVANLKLYRSEKTLGRLKLKIGQLKNWLVKMRDHPHVGDVRQAGFMAGVDIVGAGGAPFPAGARVGHAICQAARRRGLWARPLGDTLVILPPLSISSRELSVLFRAFEGAIDDVLQNGKGFSAN